MIEQYFLIQDYALWEIILTGDSFKPETKTEKVGGKDVATVSVPSTSDERTQKKNDLKARSLLLMTLPKDQIIAFSKFKTAKELFEEICSVFGCNDATKKTQKTLLKQSYENFSTSSNESLDSILIKLSEDCDTSDCVWNCGRSRRPQRLFAISGVQRDPQLTIAYKALLLSQ